MWASKKAFHLIDHTVAIREAISLDFPHNLIARLGDFLTGRSDVVHYQDSQDCVCILIADMLRGTKMDHNFLSLIHKLPHY